MRRILNCSWANQWSFAKEIKKKLAWLVLPIPEARPLSYLFSCWGIKENLTRLVYEMQNLTGPVCKEQVQEAQQQCMIMTPLL